MGGSSTTTTVVKPAPPTRQELLLQEQQLELGRQQAKAIEKASSFTDEFLKEQALTQLTVLQQQASLATTVAERAEFEFAIDRVNADILTRLQENQLQFGEAASARALELRPVEDRLLEIQLANTADAAIPGASEQLLSDLASAQARVSRTTAATSGETTDILAENLRRASASPEQIRAAIEREADLSIEAGLSDIESLSRRLGTQLRLVIAPARGLRPGDSPILDRGGEIVRTGVEQGGQLIRDVRAAQARATAEIPSQVQELVGTLGAASQSAVSDAATTAAEIATAGAETGIDRSKFVASSTGGQQNLIGAQQQFQQQLAEAAQRNRLALTGQFQQIVGTAGSLATGLATGVNPNISGAVSAEKQFRADTATTIEREQKPFGLPQVADVLGGIGGFATGAAAVSSKTYKTDKQPVTILDKLASVPVEKWRYNWDTHTMHIGPYAEDFNNAFGIGQDNPKVIAIIDYLGVMLGAVKELDFKFNSARMTHAT